MKAEIQPKWTWNANMLLSPLTCVVCAEEEEDNDDDDGKKQQQLKPHAHIFAFRNDMQYSGMHTWQVPLSLRSAIPFLSHKWKLM